MGSDLISARAQGRRREKVPSAPWAGGLLRRKVNTVWGQRAVPFPHKSPRWRERPVKAPSAFHRIPSHQKTPNPAREAPQLFRPRWTLCHPAGLFCRSCVLGNSGKGDSTARAFFMGCVSTYAVSDEPASEEGELGADSTTWVGAPPCLLCMSLCPHPCRFTDPEGSGRAGETPPCSGSRAPPPGTPHSH